MPAAAQFWHTTEPCGSPLAVAWQRHSVHSIFELTAAATPNAVAVLCADQALSYFQLNAQANQLANHLRRHGVARGSSVGICLDRSLDLIVGLLGILKAGGVYVPLDPAYPDHRLAFIQRDTVATLILAHQSTSARMTAMAGRAEVLCLDTNRAAIAAELADDLGSETSPDDLIYVMYTSGSNGIPKGVLVEHRAVVRLVRDTDYCDFDAEQVFLHHSPLAFDASTFEIWGPLLNGGRLAILPPGPPALEAIATAIRRHCVSTLWLTAGLFNLMVEHCSQDLAPIRQLVAGGEALSPWHVRAALNALRDGVVINGYGPTESTTFACCYRMTKDWCPGDNVPIGRPISRTTAHVLNEQLRPVATGEVGELCIGGDGLARGYLNRPELTRERFVDGPAGDDSPRRLYKTGDRVRCLPDGNLEFLGRLDDQVKINGHRIEPGEVEAVLRQHFAVRQAVVVARALAKGSPQLTAYVVADAATFSAAALKEYLAERLPRQMVPAIFIRLDRLPLNGNGKVDRAALPAADESQLASPARSCDGTGLEEKVAALWESILRRAVNVDENFFDLGGTSLQLLEVHAEMNRTFDCQLSVTELFEHATVRTLAARLADSCATGSSMSWAQERAKRQKHAFALSKARKVSRA